LASLLAFALFQSAGAWPAGVDHSIFEEGTGSIEDKPDILFEGDGSKDGGDSARDTRTSRIIGATLLGSGLFLCSWGISSWEVEEYQCCPAHNTGNVVKIVAGVVLLNAGLIYLLEADM
jgi:hypothetical protein